LYYPPAFGRHCARGHPRLVSTTYPDETHGRFAALRKHTLPKMATSKDGAGRSSISSGEPSGSAKPAVTTVFADDALPEVVGELSGDEAALAALGYKQEFKREFSVWTSFAVSFAVMGLLPSIATTMWYGIGYGECFNGKAKPLSRHKRLEE
jgi:hypothetical protein